MTKEELNKKRIEFNELINKDKETLSDLDIDNGSSVFDLNYYLNKKVEDYRTKLEDLQKNWNTRKLNKNDYVATVIAGKGNNYVTWGTSYKVLTSKELHFELSEKLKCLGTLGENSTLGQSNNCNNIIGKCAEVKVCNKLLIQGDKDYEAIDINDVTFSKAIRPRTLKPIDMCFNCEFIFKK